MISLSRRTSFLLRKLAKISIVVFWVGVVVLGALGWQNGYIGQAINSAKNEFYSFTGRMGFVIKDVYVSGNKNVQSSEIVNILGAVKGEPIFGITLTDAKKELEELGWVEKVKIERQLPSTLHVIVTERKPYAIWQYNGTINLIDSEGRVMVSGDAAGYSDLPIIVGKDANLFAKNLFKFLSTDDKIFNQVSSVIRVGNRRWNVRMDNGLEVKLPEEHAEAAWNNLISLQKEKNLLNRNIKYVDLRVPGKMFIEPGKEVKETN